MESLNPPSTVVVKQQFRGPPNSGNGGYVCGLFADLLTEGKHNLENQQAAEVTLRAPIPLDTSMQVLRDDEKLRVVHGETLIAEAGLTTLELDIPEPPSWEEALAVQSNSVCFKPNLNSLLPNSTGFHPICFCCGADMPEGEGLRVFPAPVRNNEQVAAAWIPHLSFADEDGNLPPEHIWTALDCPGQFAYMAADIRTGLLGRLTARVEKTVQAGEKCVVTGWRIGTEGRRHFAGTALFNSRGECCAYAKAVWVAFKPQPAAGA